MAAYDAVHDAPGLVYIFDASLTSSTTATTVQWPPTATRVEERRPPRVVPFVAAVTEEMRRAAAHRERKARWRSWLRNRGEARLLTRAPTPPRTKTKLERWRAKARALDP